MADDDVVIKVTSDMGNALAGIELLVDGMGDLIKAVKDVAATVENMGTKVGAQKKPIDDAQAAAVAYGLQLSKVFDKISDAVKDSVKAFPNMIKQVAAAGDEMLTLSSRIGVSVEDLSELKYIAGQSGADMMGLARTVQSLSGIFAESGEKGAKMRESISKIGLSVEDLKKQDPKAAFLQIVQAIQSTVPAADQGRVAMEIFGSKFRSNTMILKEDIGALQAKFKDLGGGMTTELAKAGDEYSDNLKNIEQVQENFRNQIVGAVLPALNSLLGTFPKLGGLALTVGQGLLDLTKTLGPMVVQLWASRAAFIGTAAAADTATVATRAFGTAVEFAMGPVGKILAVLGLIAGAYFVLSNATTEADKATRGMEKTFTDETNAMEDAINTYHDYHGKLNLTEVQTEELEAATRLLAKASGLSAEGFKAAGTEADKLVQIQAELLKGKKELREDAIKQREEEKAALEASRAVALARQKAAEGGTIRSRSTIGGDDMLPRMSDHLLADARERNIIIVEQVKVISDLDTKIKAASDAIKILTGHEEKAKTATDGASSGFKKLDEDLARTREIIGELTVAQKAQIKTYADANTKTEEIAKGLEAERAAAGKAAYTVEQLAAAIELYKKESEKARQEAEKGTFAKLVKTFGELDAAIKDAEKQGASGTRMLADFGKKAFEASEDAQLVNGALAIMPARVKAIADAFSAADITKKVSEFSKVLQGGLFDALKNTPQISADQLFGGMTAALDHIKELQTELRRATMTDHEKRLDILKEQEAAEIKAATTRFGVVKEEKDREIALIRAKYDDQRAVENKATGDFQRDMRLRGIKTREVLKQEVDDTDKALKEMLAHREEAGEENIRIAKETAAKAVQALKDADDAFQKMMRDAGVVTKDALVKTAADTKKILDAMIESRKRGEKEITDEQIRQMTIRYEHEKEAAEKTKSLWKQVLTENLGMLANIADKVGSEIGGTWGEVVKGAGQVIDSIGQVIKAVEAYEAAATSAAQAAMLLSGAMTLVGLFFLAKSFIDKWYAAKQAAEKLRREMETLVKVQKSFTDASKAQAQPGTAVARGGADFDLSKDLLDKIQSDAQAFANRTGEGVAKGFAQSMAVNLTSIVSEMGGISKEMFDQVASHAMPLFELIKKGGANATGSLKTLREVTNEFAQNAITAETLWSNTFRDFIKGAKDSGQEIEGLTKIINDQLSRAGEGLTKGVGGFAGPLSKQLTKVQELKKELDAIDKAADEDADPAVRLAIVEQIGTIQKAAVASGQESFDRLSRISLATFNAMLANGKSMVEAIAAIGPAVDILQTHVNDLGFVGGEAFEKLSRMRTLTTDNTALIESVGGLNQVMQTLANLGSLDQKTFDDLMNEGKNSFESLKKAGFETNEALAIMAPELETIRKLHAQNGLEIDKTTQGLIDQAVASGALKAEEMSTNQVLMDGLSAVIKALGGDIPDSFKKMAKSAADAAKTTSSEMAKVDKAAGNVQDSLAKTDWEGWASEAVSAAQDAQAAVDGVSFGTSPGGIKEIPLKLHEAIKAFDHFEHESVGSAHDVKHAIDEISKAAAKLDVGPQSAEATHLAHDTGPETEAKRAHEYHNMDTTQWIDPHAHAPRVDTAPDTFAPDAHAGGSSSGCDCGDMNFTFNITTINPDGLKQAVEKDILPRIIDALDRNNRGSQTKLKQIIG